MGNEFRVNDYQNNWQRDSNVFALKDGGFVVTWSSYFNEYDDSVETTYVAAQFYDANGKRVGSEKIMRALDDAQSESPQVTQLKNGNLVWTWSESLEGPILGNDHRIKAQVFTKDGKKLGGAFTVDTVKSTEAVAPDVVALKDGGFAVSFGLETGSRAYDDVYYRAYSSGGAARGDDKRLNVNSNKFDELVTKSAALSNGNSVVVWNSEAAIKDGTDDGRNQIRATILNDNGKAVRSDFGLTPHFGGAGGAWSDSEDFGYAVAARSGGGFAVANLDWTPNKKDGGTKGIYFTAYDSKGKADGKAVTVFDKAVVPGDVEMARLASGHYVVTWDQQSLNKNDVGDDAYAVLLSSSGKPISKVFELGVDLTKYDDQIDTSVAALAGGGFAVTYSSEAIDIDNEGIAARVFGRGTAKSDKLKVDASGIVSGLGGNDQMTGNASANWLSGDSGNDRIAGGSGKDMLTGGRGNDTFIFSSAVKKANADEITDFTNKRGNNDLFELDRDVFKELDRGKLDKAEFVAGTKAKDGSDHIVYNRKSGELHYDSNGSKSGGAQLVATLDNKPTLTADDFFVV